MVGWLKLFQKLQIGGIGIMVGGKGVKKGFLFQICQIFLSKKYTRAKSKKNAKTLETHKNTMQWFLESN